MKRLLFILLVSVTCHRLDAQNVGIGTTTPQATLHIKGSADTSHLVIDASADQTNLHPLIRLRNAAGIDLLHIHSDDSTNTFIGNGAGKLNTAFGGLSGKFNSFIGAHAGYFNRTGYANTATGFQALYSDSIGELNTASGTNALYSNKRGHYNTAAGAYTLGSNKIGWYNSANGYAALYGNTEGSYNTAEGSNALYSNVAGSNATAIGYKAMVNANPTTTPFTNYNVAVGYEALRGSTTINNNTGNYNTALGYQTLLNNSTGNYNTASGHYALNSNTTGIDNTANGVQALYFNSIGSDNTASGVNALYFNTGSGNTASGSYALYNNHTGNSNTANGLQALTSNNSGAGNTAIGLQALYYNVGGSENTALGDFAGYGASGVDFTQCTFVGSNSHLTVPRTNVTLLGAYIANAQCTGNNQVLLGSTNIASIRAQVTGITAYSDARFKRNIRDDVKGLDFIMKLKPVTYNQDPEMLHNIWGTPDSLLKKIDHSEIKKQRFIGFLAQDVEKAAKESSFDFPGIDVPKNDKEVYSLRYADFIMPMIKAIQEQQVIIETLQKQVETAKAETPIQTQKQQKIIDDLKARLEKLEKLLISQ